jgi:FKBP-type peptidyl-prolyl cis-trans isomerase FkpA
MNRFVLRVLTAAVSLAMTSLAVAQTPSTPAATPAPKAQAGAGGPKAAMTEDQKTLYALGALLSRNLDSFSLTDAEFNTVREGFTDGYHHKPQTKDAEGSIQQVQALQRTRSQKIGMAYLDKAAKAPGAAKTASGLVYLAVKEGTGPSPARSDKVKVTYEGRLTDGTVFDSSAQHGGSATFPVTGVIACWTEALQLMKVGGSSRIVCPSQIAYGDRGAPPKIRPGSTLECDITLLEIEPAPPPPAADSTSSGAGTASAPATH